MKAFLLVIYCFFAIPVFSQTNYSTQEIEVNSLIKGNLLTPTTGSKTLLILIAGSGPTNRNGNQPGVVTNCYKFLGQQLAQNGIAFFSYDKRIIAQMINKTVDESSLRFEDMVTDAVAVLNYFKKENTYTRIVIAGHSEGSLIGLLAAQQGVQGFVSLSGPGRPANEVLAEQLAREKPEMYSSIKQCIDAMKLSGKWQCDTPLKNAALLFRPSVIPYLNSWFQYNPAVEIQKLKIPVLIINGDKDLQVAVTDAELLKKAAPTVQISIIPNMNHILKITPTEEENRKSYTDGNLPIAPTLPSIITQFVNQL